MNNSFKKAVLSSILIFLLLFIIFSKIQAQATFQVVPLGVKGGGDESNLSSYMLAPYGSNHYVCLDAGTVRAGINKAIEKGAFKVSEEKILRQYIKGYLISHGHLDHVSGMILNSPDDTAKNIYAISPVIDILKDKYFSWKSWANFADEGEAPKLKKYTYKILDTLSEVPIEQTAIFIRAFPLSHVNPYKSTAFLIRYKNAYIVYAGDTGADTIEHSNDLLLLWQHIAPLINRQQLKGIFIEVSFPNEQPTKQLFGHLTPSLLMNELQRLNKLCIPGKLKNTPIIITHMKPVGNNEQKIKQQLKKNNSLNIRFQFPHQGFTFTL